MAAASERDITFLTGVEPEELRRRAPRDLVLIRRRKMGDEPQQPLARRQVGRARRPRLEAPAVDDPVGAESVDRIPDEWCGVAVGELRLWRNCAQLDDRVLVLRPSNDASVLRGSSL